MSPVRSTPARPHPVETLLSRTLARPLTVRGRFGPRASAETARAVPASGIDSTLASERFATRWSDTAALSALAAAKRAPLAPALGAALEDYHRRLGASPASLESLEKLIRGDAVASVAGQQPAPLGGPLYSLHKTASAVGNAAEVASRTGVPCVPLFWMHGEDSDFAEIRGITVADAALTLHELELPASAHRDGGLVGAIAAAPLAALERDGLAHWASFPGHHEVERLLASVHGRARDLGEAFSALMLAVFAEQGLVVIDPRLPAFRDAARPILERYLARADELAAAVRRAGDLLEARTGERPLAGPSLESFVFAIEDGLRRKVTPAQARALGSRAVLSPSVALRAAAQDGVFPTVVMACGAAELAYLAQLREVFEGVGVHAACPIPRISLTWVPASGIELLEASGGTVEELVFQADALLRRHAESRMPADVREALERGQQESQEALARIAEALRRVDPSLPQMVESARGKVEFQFARLHEGLAGKLRHKVERQHPEWARLRYYLRPGDRFQERRLASLEPLARRGPGVVGELCRLAAEHARRVEAGEVEHLVVEL